MELVKLTKFTRLRDPEFRAARRQLESERLCAKIQFANGARFALPKMVEGPPGCPSGPSITCSSSTLAGDFGPLHRGPISRPYPTREPLLIGAPRAGSAEPTDGQAIAASGTTIRNCIQCQQETIKL